MPFGVPLPKFDPEYPNAPMNDKSQELMLLMSLSFEKLFADLDIFMANIPALARLIGVDEFRSQMGLSKPQYYRRINEPGKHWTVLELKKAKDIFLNYNIGV